MLGNSKGSYVKALENSKRQLFRKEQELKKMQNINNSLIDRCINVVLTTARHKDPTEIAAQLENLKANTNES